MEYDIEAIRHRQKLFAMTIKSSFMGKIEKYHGHMVNYGIHIDYRTMECLTKSHSFEDNIELILCKSSTTINPRQAFKKIGNRLSLAKFFRWIYLLVQRTKAARILSHMNGVSQQEIKDIVGVVGQEVGVAYEYQLMMLHDDGEVIRLARHAVTCMMFYLNGSGSAFSAKDLLQAVLEVKPQSSRNKDVLRVHPLYVGGKQTSYKWKLGQLFKQPGLRMHSDDVEADTSEYTAVESEGHENKEFDDDLNRINQAELVKKNVDALDNPLNDKNSSGLAGNDIELFENTQSNTDDKGEEKENECSDSHDENSVEEVEIGLEEVSSVILGQSDPHTGAQSPNDPFDRRISTIEMDYEQGKLHIEKHSITISDFSPVEKFADSVDEEEQKKDICRENLGFDMPSSLEDEEEKDITAETEASEREPKKNPQNVTDNPDLQIEGNQYQGTNDDQNLVDRKADKSSENEEEGQYKFYGCFTPYGAKCRPEKYGFRGPLRVWDEGLGGYSLTYRDKVTIRCTYNRALPADSGNPHQAYRPRTKVVDGNIVYM